MQIFLERDCGAIKSVNFPGRFHFDITENYFKV